MVDIFFSYFGYLAIGIAAAYFSGFFFLLKTRLLPQKRFTAIFSSLVIGLTIFAILTALAACRFNSVLLGIPVLAAVVFSRLRNKKSSASDSLSPVTFRSHLHNLLALWLAGLIIFSFRFYFGYLEYGQPSLHQDLIFYAKLSAYLLKTGLETSNIEYIYLEENPVLPYHYYELWLNGFFLKLFGANSVHLLYLVTYSIGILAVWTGFCALFENKLNVTRSVQILCLACLILTGVDFPDFRNKIFEFTVYLQFNTVFYAKLFPIFIGLIAALLLYLHKQEKAAYISLLFLPLVSVVSAPGVVGGLFAFVIYLFARGQKKDALELAAITIGFTLFIVIFYNVINPPGSTPYKSYLSEQLSQLLTWNNLKNMVVLELKTVLQLIVTTGLFILFTVYFIGLKDFRRSLKSNGIVLTACMILAASLSWAINEEMNDSLQFLTNLAAPVFNILMVFLLSVAWAKAFRKVYLVAIVLVYVVFNYLETIKYINVKPEFSAGFAQSVLQKLDGLNPIGVYMRHPDEYQNPYPKSSNIFPKGLYLAYADNKYAYHTINLGIFDIPINPAKVALETQLVQNTSFYKFVARQKAANTFKSIPESQNDFVEQYRIDYLLLSKDVAVPPTLESKVILENTDPVSEDRFYLFKK
ncbi:hypothetical protein [Adhaeribacter terreus]|uniref:Uncharacterized protein n=1 Tax=Adhaeribacter terreus TaxID=529703 RepID=A0ABW0EDE3_9BACT